MHIVSPQMLSKDQILNFASISLVPMRGFCGAVAPAANTITREHVNMNRVIGD